MRTSRFALGAFALSSLLACSGGDSTRDAVEMGAVPDGQYVSVAGQPDLKIHRAVTLVSERFKREVIIEPNQLRVPTRGNEEFLAKVIAKRSVLMSGGIPEANKLGFTRGILGVSVVGSETILRTMDLPTMAFLKGTVRTMADGSGAAAKTGTGANTKGSSLSLQDLGDSLESKRNDRLAQLISLRNDNLTLLDVEVSVSSSGTITVRPVDDSYASNGSFARGSEAGEPSSRGTNPGAPPTPPSSTSAEASGTVGIKLKLDTRLDIAGSAYIGAGGCNILRLSDEGFALGEEAKDLLAAIGANWWDSEYREGIGAAALCGSELLDGKLKAEAQMEAFGLGYLNAEITVAGRVKFTKELFNRAMEPVIERLEKLSPKIPVACGPVPCEVQIVPKVAAALTVEGFAKLTTKVPYGLGFVVTAGGGYGVQRPGLYPIGNVTGHFQGAEWDATGQIEATATIGGAIEVSFGLGNSRISVGGYSADARAFVQTGLDFVFTAGLCPSFDWGVKIDPKAKAGVQLLGRPNYTAETPDLLGPSFDKVIRKTSCL